MTDPEPHTDPETIALRFRFDLDAFLEANERYEDQIPALRFTHGVLAISRVILLLCGAYLLVVGEWRVASLALLVAGLSLFVRSARRFLAARNYRKSPHADEDVVLELGPDGLHGLATRGEVRYPWAALTRAFFKDDGVLLLRGPHLFHWLPDRAIVKGDPASLRALVRAHVAEPRPRA